MTAPQILNHYVDRYGEKEGYCLAIQFCEFWKEASNFPTCLEWCEMIREINEIIKTK